MHDLLDGRTVKIQSLLAAFSDPVAEMPLLPPAQTPCGHLDSPSLCTVHLVPVQNLRQPGNDMAFADWLETTLTGGKDKKELELNWRDVLVARTARLKRGE
ncbi:hypothetical protein [Bordetella tumulicola]|uniref:hypothetical protein n=1 Tax=Bordetella tumulicola TaxID=1649133 RepID=UPI0039EE75B0